MNDSIALAAALAREYEGLSLRPYICPAGYWTIGYGNRCLADGAAVTARTRPITRQQAEDLLLFTLAGLRLKLRALIHVPVTPNQEAALLDWQYNLGTSAIAGSTLLRLLNSGQTIAAGEQLLLWDHMHRNGHLVRVPGLTRRRQAEWHLYVGATGAGSSVPSSPTPSNPTENLNMAELYRLKANA
ncbi:lysozyme [Acetobacter senegalensis]|uniref:Lysozyme n=1 Tax=Acetobacter senegalensis TaxID=446692 RepID=A0A0U5ETU2_9PROT|nr:lysozyme [Acetobacter senegalensis]CEF41147.1 lysozyme [Acetobacter senegalensis]